MRADFAVELELVENELNVLLDQEEHFFMYLLKICLCLCAVVLLMAFQNQEL